MVSRTYNTAGRNKTLHDRQREEVRKFYLTHVGCTQMDAARSLNLNHFLVNEYVRELRADWITQRHAWTLGGQPDAEG